MIRTQVYLSDNQYRAIHQLAGKKNKPAAEILRELIDRGLQTTDQPSAKQALLELVKIGKNIKATGPTNLSSTIDSELYE